LGQLIYLLPSFRSHFILIAVSAKADECVWLTISSALQQVRRLPYVH
jgi:hypothetical protein